METQSMLVIKLVLLLFGFGFFGFVVVFWCVFSCMYFALI